MEKIKEENYISRKETLELLGMWDKTFSKFEEKYKLEHTKIKNVKYYNKEDIYFFKEQQNHIGQTYVTLSMAREKYKKYLSDPNCYLWTKINTIKPPLFCYNKNIMKPNETLCDINEVDELIKEVKRKETASNIFGKTVAETFELRLALYKDDLPIFEKSQYTKKKWVQFLSQKLLRSTQNKDFLCNRKIPLYINLTFLIEEKLQELHIDEIYMLTSNQINMWLISIEKEQSRHYLYYFFSFIYKDIQLKLQISQKFRKGFDFKKVIKYDDPRFHKNKKPKPIKAQIYGIDTYMALFKFLIDIPFHIKNTIQYNHINITYLSLWLYLLLHMNNGWRNSDIVTFPRLYFQDLLDEWKITDCNWFLKNQISKEKSRRVITRITEYDFIASKTKAINHFFCSDRLAPAVATAILLFEIYYSSENNVTVEFNQPIMQFKKDSGNRPTANLVKEFLKEFEIEDFVFSSKKMNKTILTLIYETLCNISPSGYNELLAPKFLRAHKSEFSTLHYVQFSEKQLDFLTYELFERGEFGYIYDTLVNAIVEKSDKHKTNEISLVKNLFGDHQKIEATANMLNSFKNEQNEIIDMLNKYSLDECITLMNNIYTNKLPSKKKHIQCLHSETGCKCPDSECETCKYSIPNIYMLNTLGKKLIKEMKEYNKEMLLCKKIKLSSLIHNEIEFLMAANRKYGKEYVYNCMDIDRQDFVDMFDEILEVKDLVKLMEPRGE